MVEDDPLHHSDDAAQILHQSPSTLETWRSRGKGPNFIKLGRLVFYRESALRAFIKAQERAPKKSA